eukprot:s1599_g12.t1
MHELTEQGSQEEATGSGEVLMPLISSVEPSDDEWKWWLIPSDDEWKWWLIDSGAAVSVLSEQFKVYYKCSSEEQVPALRDAYMPMEVDTPMESIVTGQGLTVGMVGFDTKACAALLAEGLCPETPDTVTSLQRLHPAGPDPPAKNPPSRPIWWPFWPAGGLRPIAIGELLRRLTGKCLMAQVQATAREHFFPAQQLLCPQGLKWPSTPPVLGLSDIPCQQNPSEAGFRERLQQGVLGPSPHCSAVAVSFPFTVGLLVLRQGFEPSVWHLRPEACCWRPTVTRWAPFFLLQRYSR